MYFDINLKILSHVMEILTHMKHLLSDFFIKIFLQSLYILK